MLTGVRQILKLTLQNLIDTPMILLEPEFLSLSFLWFNLLSSMFLPAVNTESKSSVNSSTPCKKVDDNLRRCPGKKMVANLHLNLQNGVNKALNMLETSMGSLGRYPLSALPHNPGFHLLSLETNDSMGQEVSFVVLELGIRGRDSESLLESICLVRIY